MPTLRVALTGGIATGKSYCLARITEAGIPSVDADRLAHEAIAPGTPGNAAVAALFGRAVVGPGGAIDRAAVGRIVFADAKLRRELETIVHPIVYRGISQWFAELADTGGRVGVADIPLLYETGREIDFEKVIVAACPPAMQIERLMTRNGLSRADAEARIAAQIPIETKAARADYVIDTSGSFAETDTQLRALIADLSGG